MKLHNVVKIFLICIFILGLTIPSLATNNVNFDVNAFENASGTEAGKKVETALGQVAGVVRIIGTGISIIVIVVIACKYMIASAGDRAEIKKNAIPFVVGAIVLFGASGIFEIIVDFASGIK